MFLHFCIRLQTWPPEYCGYMIQLAEHHLITILYNVHASVCLFVRVPFILFL